MRERRRAERGARGRAPSLLPHDSGQLTSVKRKTATSGSSLPAAAAMTDLRASSLRALPLPRAGCGAGTVATVLELECAPPTERADTGRWRGCSSGRRATLCVRTRISLLLAHALC